MKPLAQTRRLLAVALLTTAAGCSEAPSGLLSPPDANFGKTPTSEVAVTSTAPQEAGRDTTLDVQILGSGFDRGSSALFLLHGTSDARVRVNATSYVKSTQLVANVTIAADAVADLYDVLVQTGGGKKGIGTEMFAVTLSPEALPDGNHANAVNVAADIVGSGTNTAGCLSQGAAVVWKHDGSRIELPLGNYCGAGGAAINASGVVVGSLGGGAPNARAIWVPSNGTYTMQEIAPTPDGIRPISAGAFNDANELVGWRQGAPGLYWWSPATGWLPMQLPAGATLCTVRDALNNQGQIAANCSINGGAYDVFYWSSHDAAPVLLPKPPASGDAAVRDINDAGIIVGSAAGRAARWTPSSAGYQLELLPDFGSGSVAHAITNDGTIAGTANRTTNNPRPVMWSAGRMKELGTLAGRSTGEALGAFNTTNGLVIVGTNNQQAVKWTVPGGP